MGGRSKEGGGRGKELGGRWEGEGDRGCGADIKKLGKNVLISVFGWLIPGHVFYLCLSQVKTIGLHEYYTI